MKLSRAILVFVFLSTFATALKSDEPHQHGAAPERLGKIDFPVSCNAAARQRFERYPAS